MINTSLAKLNPAECVVDENNKKLSKDLKAAYKIAEEEHDLDYYKKMLSEHEKEMQNIAEEQARYEAEIVAKEQEKADKAAKKLEDKPKSKSRKSKGAEDSEMDLDGSESKSSSKKRKKEAESEGEGKPKKTPKVKLAASKDQGTPSAKKSKKAAPSDSTEPQTEAQKFEARKLRGERLFEYCHNFLTNIFSPPPPSPLAKGIHFPRRIAQGRGNAYHERLFQHGGDFSGHRRSYHSRDQGPQGPQGHHQDGNHSSRRRIFVP